jgi:hypothetical protein
MINRRNVLKATAVGGSGLAALAYSPKPTLAANNWSANSPSQVSNENGELSSLEIPASGFSFSMNYSGLGSGSHSIDFELEAKLESESSFETVFSDSFDVEGDSGTVNESKLSTSFPVDLLANTSLSASDFNESNVGDSESTTVELRVSFNWNDGEYSSSDSATNSFDVSVERAVVGPTDGLVSYYPFNGDVDDAWGNNNGTDNTSAGYVDGVSGQAKDFDGTDDYVEVSNDSSLNLSGAVTISCWAKGASQYTIVGKMAGSSEPYLYRIYVSGDGDATFYVYGDDNTQYGAGGGPDLISSNKWHHLLGTFYDGTLYFYVDASLVGTSSGPSSLHSSPEGPFYIGGEANYNEFQDTTLDEVRIYNRGLSESEVNDLYNATS